MYKCVTEIREYSLRKIPCFCFVYLHASTDSMTDQRRWENIQLKIHVWLCTWQVHVKQVFPEAPWWVRKISDQSYLMFESPTVLHLPAISGRYIDSEKLSGWLDWRKWWLQGCLCGCQSSVTAPTTISQRQNYRAECWGQFTELLIQAPKSHMYSLLWFRRRLACHTQGTVRAVRIYA